MECCRCFIFNCFLKSVFPRAAFCAWVFGPWIGFRPRWRVSKWSVHVMGFTFISTPIWPSWWVNVLIIWFSSTFRWVSLFDINSIHVSTSCFRITFRLIIVLSYLCMILLWHGQAKGDNVIFTQGYRCDPLGVERFDLVRGISLYSVTVSQLTAIINTPCVHSSLSSQQTSKAALTNLEVRNF
jgi:hypothetical protein